MTRTAKFRELVLALGKKKRLLMRGAGRRRRVARETRQRAVLVAAVAPARFRTPQGQRLVAASPDTEIASNIVGRLHRLVILSVGQPRLVRVHRVPERRILEVVAAVLPQVLDVRFRRLLRLERCSFVCLFPLIQEALKCGPPSDL